MNTATISADHLCVGYGKHPVVEGVMLDMHPGELLVLIGTNGSGNPPCSKLWLGSFTPCMETYKCLANMQGSCQPALPTCLNTQFLRTRFHCKFAMW